MAPISLAPIPLPRGEGEQRHGNGKAASGRRTPSPHAARWAAYAALFKLRLVALVAASTAAGFLLADKDGLCAWRLVWTILGTALAAGGAQALNQWLEMDSDACMADTCRRPLPSRRLPRRAAALAGLAVGALGLLVLGLGASWPVAGLALAAAMLYLFAYTPLKKRTPICVPVGAVCGALPPLLGWVAAAGAPRTPVWLLAALVYLWQVPHFLSLAWVRREEYRRAGFGVLADYVSEDRGAACLCLLYSLGLLPVTWSVTLAGVAGWTYQVAALAAGAGLVAACALFYREQTEARARCVFRATLLYLPLVLVLMVADSKGIGD